MTVARLRKNVVCIKSNASPQSRRWLDRHRFLAISILLVVAVPVVGSIGYFGITSTRTTLLAVSFLAGFCVVGIQSGINVAGALIHPTSLSARTRAMAPKGPRLRGTTTATKQSSLPRFLVLLNLRSLPSSEVNFVESQNEN